MPYNLWAKDNKFSTFVFCLLQTNQVHAFHEWRNSVNRHTDNGNERFCKKQGQAVWKNNTTAHLYDVLILQRHIAKSKLAGKSWLSEYNCSVEGGMFVKAKTKRQPFM